MKKFTTKLLMSIIAVAFAFVALGTSTYAWFSMNTTVKAENMVVTAKSDSTYLLIGTSQAAATVQAGNATEADAVTEATSTEVYPIAFNKTEKTIYLNGKTADNAQAADTQVIPANTWYTLSNKNTNNATDELTNYAAHAENALTGYVVKYTAYLCLSKDSQTAFTGKLNLAYSLAANGEDDADAAISTMVKIYNGANVLESSDVLTSTANSYTTNASVTINNTDTVKVEMWVFIDGNSANVYSDYINGTAQQAAKNITGKAVVSFSLGQAD
jgi:hypothetical protein